MLRRKRELIQTTICIALLFVVPLLLATPAIKQGDLAVDINALTTRTPWQEAQPTGLEPAVNDEYSPVINRYYPWYAFMNHAGRSGELPLWNPYESFGTPFLALWRTRALSPFSLPLYVLPLHTALGISVFLKLLVAGLCAYYAARRFHFSPIYALLPAITFQMSGFLLVGHWHPASDVIPWFPLLLPCLQRILLGNYRIWPSVALLIGIMTIGGDPETLVGILLFLFLLTLIYGIRTYTLKHLAGALITLFFSVILGLTLAAVQLIPFFEFLQQGSLESSIPDSFRGSDLAMLLAPISHSNSITEASWLPSGLIGFLLLPLWLAVRPAANRIRKRRMESFLLATLALLLLSLCAPLLRGIPIFAYIDTWHFAVPFPLAAGMLAATAIEEWVHLDADKCKESLKKLAWLIPLFLGTAFLFTFWVSDWKNNGQQGLNNFLWTSGSTLIVLSLLLISAFWPKEKLLVASLSLITAVLCWHIYTPTAHFTPAQQIFPETRFIQTLHGQNSRVAGSKHLQDWPLSPYQIEQSYSPSGIVLNRNQHFMDQAAKNPKLLRLSGAQTLLLTKEDIQERFSPLRPMLNIQEVFPSGAILLKDLQANER
ncbi:MAG: YfhO family protein, partial [Candidatus Hydrogenedentes bacterium]|nr:YfhO family protein [Candidatus Hydrogenedentota bacterium]